MSFCISYILYILLKEITKHYLIVELVTFTYQRCTIILYFLVSVKMFAGGMKKKHETRKRFRNY